MRAIPFDYQLAVPPGDAWSTRDLVARLAAWLDEANDRIPRLLAGAPSIHHDADAFNAAAVGRAAAWTPEQAFAAFRRAADRFDAIVAESDAVDLADSEDAMAWLEKVARRLLDEHAAELDRLAEHLSTGGRPRGTAP